GEGPWDSPFSSIGGLIGRNLDKSFPVGVPLSGVMVALGFLLLVHVHRRVSGSRIDDIGRPGTAPPIIWAIMCSFLTMLALCLSGFATGGNLQMIKAQVQSFVLLLLLAYLLSVTLRGMKDIRILGVA